MKKIISFVVLLATLTSVAFSGAASAITVEPDDEDRPGTIEMPGTIWIRDAKGKYLAKVYDDDVVDITDDPINLKEEIDLRDHKPPRTPPPDEPVGYIGLNQSHKFAVGVMAGAGAGVYATRNMWFGGGGVSSFK